jgi:hypothetical protein
LCDRSDHSDHSDHSEHSVQGGTMKYNMAMVNGTPVVTTEPYEQDTILWAEVDPEAVARDPKEELRDILITILVADRCDWSKRRA